MSEIASLGVKIDSTDATRAAGELDKLTAAGARTEKAINRLHDVAQRAAADMSALNGRVDTLNGTQNRMLAAVERVASQMDRMAASYERSARAAGTAARAYDQVGREASGSAANVDRMNRSLTQTESSAAAAGASIRRHLLVTLSGLSVMRVIDMADEWGQMASRIRMATQSADEYERVQARMLQSANATYRNINETREAFIQLSPVLRQMGMSLEESMDVIDAFSGLLVVNSANAERGAAAMRALAVALQKGKLDADGWITIYSTVDSIVDVLAEHTGIAAEELRRLGAEGKLSVEMLAQSLVGQVQPIMQQVEGMPTTVRDALQRVGNAFSEYIGTANEANHVTATMARGIELVGEHMEGVMTVAIAAGTAGLARYAAGLAATVTQTTAQALQARIAAAEELRLAQAQMAAAQASVAQTAAMRGLTATMAQQTAAANALVAAEERLVAAKAGVAAAGRSVLGILAGPAGIAITAGLAATAFMTMGGSARAASADIDTLSSSLSDLTQKQLELRRVELEDQVASLEEKAIESSQALLGLQRDFDALYTSAAQGANITSAELENVKRTILEQEVAHEKNSAALDKARHLLDQVVVRLRDLDLAARGAAGGVDGLNRAMGFTEAGEKYLAQIQARIKALQDGGDPVKAATRWILEHANASEADKTAIMSAALAEKALIEARDRAAKATKSGAQAVNEAKKAEEAFERSRRQYLNGLYSEISALQDQARGLEEQIALYGLAESAKYDLAIADLEAQKAALAVIDAGAEEIAILERKIELLQQMKGSQQTLERLDAEKQAWETWSRDVEQIFQQIGQSLTDALFEGGRSARDLIKDLFKSLVLRVLIQPVMGGLQGLFMGAGPAGIANAGSAAGGLMGSPTSLFSMFGGNSIGMGISNALTSLSTSSMFAGTGVGNWMMGTAGNVAGMSNLALGGAGFLGGIGAGLLFGNKGYSSAGGSVGGTIGMALGGPVGAIAGSLLGGALGSLFGDDKPDTRHAQMSHTELLGDGKVHVSTWDDRQSVESQKAAAQIAEQSINAALDLFDKIGIDAEFKRFTTLMESSILGDKQGVGSSATIRIGDLEHEIGLAIESSWTKHGFGGWSEAEMLPRLQTDIQLTLLEAFQVAGDALPSVLSGMLEGVDIRSLGAEQAQALAQQFSLVVEQVSAVQEAINNLPFEQLRDLSFDAAANLIQFAGGVEQLNAGMTSYFQNFYSQEEQLEFATNQVAKVFEELGLTMPDLSHGAEIAKQQYRALVESLDITTEEGQKAYATLMTLSGGFAELVTGLDDLKTATDNSANALRERESLERQLLSLYGNTAALRALELGNLDASNRALQQRIWALQDEAAAYQEAVAKYNQARADTDAAWATVQAVAQREIARLQETFAQTDSIYKALTKAADVQRRALTEQARAAEQLIATLRGVIDITGSAARDLRGSVAETAQMQYAQAMDVIRRAAGGELPDRDQLAEAITAARNVVENPDQYATGFERDFAMLSLANELERIQNAAEPQLSVQEQALEVAKQQQQALENMLQEAKAQIDVLRGVDDKLYEQVLETIKTQLTSQGQLDKLSDIDVNTFVAEKLMQDLVTAQMAEQQARLQIDAINNQVNIAQDSYNELRGINNKTSSMITALNNLAQAMSAERVTNPGTPTGGGTPTVVIPDVITNPNHGFERYQVMGKRNYMPTTTEEWLDYVNLQPDLKAAFAAEVARGARTYSDAHMVEWARWHYNTSGKKEMHVRRYASGGFYPGGIAMVGEEGPELINFAQPGQVYTASQTQDLLRRLSNPVENTSVIARHIERLTQENVALRQTVETLGRATVEMQYRMVRMLERWETDGMPDTREELQAQMLETLEDIKENGIKVIEEVSE